MMVARNSVTAEDFASSWLARVRSQPAGTAVWNISEWVVDAEIPWAVQRPEVLLEAILTILDSGLSDEELRYLGAGPIENLLNFNYLDFAPKLLALASNNVSLRSAMEVVNPPLEYEEQYEVELSKIES